MLGEKAWLTVLYSNFAALLTFISIFQTGVKRERKGEEMKQRS